MCVLWYYVETKTESKKTIVALKDQWFNMTKEIFFSRKISLLTSAVHSRRVKLLKNDFREHRITTLQQQPHIKGTQNNF